MAKINLDKYYTPSDLAEYCVNKTKEIIGVENITEWLEPSAGAGVFLPYLDSNYLAFDIEPEAENIEQKNYLELYLPYFKGRCIVGNPPYGKGNYTSVQFFKKAITQGDYIAFILPVSQLNNNMYMYEFDLVYSEDLGKRKYSDRNVHCVLNIYKRNPKGLNPKPNFDLQDIELRTVGLNKARNDKKPTIYDLTICKYGASFGKICKEDEYAQQIYIHIKNEKYKKLILTIFEKTEWKDIYNMTATPVIKHWMINKYLKEQIPNLN